MSSDRAALTAVAKLAPHGLDAAQQSQLAAVLDALANDEHAPTAVHDPQLAADVHLADSLAALELSAVREARSIADLGSGAGFPGLPLAVALPHAHVSLIESQRRSSEFLARVCAAARVENAVPVWTR